MNHATLLDRLVQAHHFQANTGGDSTATGEPLEGVTRNNVNPAATPTATVTVTPTQEGSRSMFTLPDEGNQMVVETVAPTSTIVEVPDDPMGGMTWVWITAIIALAVVALGAMAMILLRRKPGKQVPPPAAGVPDEPITAENLESTEAATVQMTPPMLKVGYAQHIGRRSDQQDSYGISSVSEAPLKGLLAVVADGMGGMSDGAAISQMAVKTIIGGFQSLPVEQNPPLQMVRLACGAHKAICSMPSSGQGGSTLLMAYIWDEWLFTLSIGDSRMYLMRDHTLMQLNREHTYGVELDERAALGEISLEQAMSDPQRKALTSYLGIEDLQKIDRTLRPFPLRRGDRIALMSDGVFGTINDSEIQLLLELPPQEAAQQIQEAVLLKNQPRQDNLTVVIVAYE